MQPERADVNKDLGACPGSRASTEPCSTVSALTGFDPARWWRELRNPSLKCARVGHAMREDEQQFYDLPSIEKDISWARFVAVEVTEVTPRCSRCGLTQETREVDRRGLNGLTMNGDRWSVLRRVGRIPA